MHLVQGCGSAIQQPWYIVYPGSVFTVSLQSISATFAHPVLPSQVVSICDLQRLALHWFPAPRLLLAVNGPATWNHLPPALRSPDLSESAFKWALKTHLFSTARCHWDVLIILALDINIQTYLCTASQKTCQLWQAVVSTSRDNCLWLWLILADV